MTYFSEEQRFRQGWLWVLMIVQAVIIVGLFGIGMYYQLVLGRPWGARPMPDMALVIVGSLSIAFSVGTTVLFAVMRLVTEVTDDALVIRFHPFVRRTIPYDRITKCEARRYSPVREYGGWGIRYGKKGRAYNVSGNKGVQLELIDDTPLLIGSQKAELLAEAIRGRMKRP